MTTLDTDGARDLAPPRLLDGGGSAFERLLVEPSRDRGVPRASLERLAFGLQLPPEALPPEALPSEALPPEPSSDRSPAEPAQRQPDHAPPAAEAAPDRAVSWLARPAARLGLGAAGVVAIGMGLGALRTSPAVPAESAREAASVAALGVAPGALSTQTLTQEPARQRARAPAGPAVEPAVPVAPPAASPAPAVSATSAAPPARAPAPAQRPAAATSRATHRGLGAELRALEAAQRALAERRIEDGNRALRDYEQHFPEGELALEAELLGVEAALASGRLERARSQAQQLAARPAAARYRERLDALMRSLEARGAGVKSRRMHINGAEVTR